MKSSSSNVLQVAVFAYFMNGSTDDSVKEKHRVMKSGKLNRKKGVKMGVGDTKGDEGQKWGK